MIHSVRFTCVLDTNVIYPIEIRDILLWFAHYNLYTPKWSKHIFDEWENVMKRKGIDEKEIARRTERVQTAFPDALVENYEPLISGLTLPDPKDCHILAAAIKTKRGRLPALSDLVASPFLASLHFLFLSVIRLLSGRMIVNVPGVTKKAKYAGDISDFGSALVEVIFRYIFW